MNLSNLSVKIKKIVKNMPDKDINRIVIAEHDIAEHLSNILISNVTQKVETNLRILDFELEF